MFPTPYSFALTKQDQKMHFESKWWDIKSGHLLLRDMIKVSTWTSCFYNSRFCDFWIVFFERRILMTNWWFCTYTKSGILKALTPFFFQMRKKIYQHCNMNKLQLEELKISMNNSNSWAILQNMLKQSHYCIRFLPLLVLSTFYMRWFSLPFFFKGACDSSCKSNFFFVAF